MAISTMSKSASAGDLLQCRCEDLVAPEIARLSRRVPALNDERLRHVEAAFVQVMDRLVLARTRTVSGADLTALFELEDAR